MTIDKEVTVTPTFAGYENYENYERTIAKISRSLCYDEAGCDGCRRLRDRLRDRI